MTKSSACLRQCRRCCYVSMLLARVLAERAVIDGQVAVEEAEMALLDAQVKEAEREEAVENV